MKLHSPAATGLLLLAVAACSGGASSAPASATVTGSATPVTERDFKLDTPIVAVSGVVSLAVTNAGPTIHNLAIRSSGGAILGTTKDLKPGTSETLTADIPAGTYAIICTLPGHESLGLKGTLTVTR